MQYERSVSYKAQVMLIVQFLFLWYYCRPIVVYYVYNYGEVAYIRLRILSLCMHINVLRHKRTTGSRATIICLSTHHYFQS